MYPAEHYFKSADALAQEIVSFWGLNTAAGSAKDFTPEFLDIFEKACRYQEVKRLTDFYRERNALSETEAQKEEMARRTFIDAYKPWAEAHAS